MAWTSGNIFALASTIQGEASTPSGQFAVASTMQNRLAQGIDTPQSIFSVGSFEANNHFTQPSPFALQMATAVSNGTVGDYGNPGNATYYNATGTNPAYDSGGSIIGGNSFSDTYNASPSSNYVAPSYGGSTAPTPAATNFDSSQPSSLGYNSDALAPMEGNGQEINQANGFGLSGAQSTAGNVADSTALPGALGDSSGVGAGLNSSFSLAPDNNTVQDLPDQSATVQAPTQAQQGQGTNNGLGIPIDVTDVTSAGSVAGNAIQSGLSSAASSIQKSAQGIDQQAQQSTTAIDTTGTNLIGSLEQFGTNIFIRFGLVAFGLVVLAGAIGFLYLEKQNGKTASV